MADNSSKVAGGGWVASSAIDVLGPLALFIFKLRSQFGYRFAQAGERTATMLMFIMTMRLWQPLYVHD
jgi:hypothetical protein